MPVHGQYCRSSSSSSSDAVTTVTIILLSGDGAATLRFLALLSGSAFSEFSGDVLL